MWLFENNKIQVNSNYFEDVLGRGLNGEVVGKRARVKAIKIAKYNFQEALVSYPNSKYFPLFNFTEERNGSIGAGILHRFTIIFDYQNNQMLLSPNSKIDDPFNYNMSGLEVQHNGSEIYKETIPLSNRASNSGQRLDQFIQGTDNFLYKFSLKPIFEVAALRANSPAALSGILVGDIIKRIQYKNIQRFTLQQINELLQSQDGKWINIEVERKGEIISYHFQLQKKV